MSDPLAKPRAHFADVERRPLDCQVCDETEDHDGGRFVLDEVSIEIDLPGLGMSTAVVVRACLPCADQICALGHEAVEHEARVEAEALRQELAKGETDGS